MILFEKRGLLLVISLIGEKCLVSRSLAVSDLLTKFRVGPLAAPCRLTKCRKCVQVVSGRLTKFRVRALAVSGR